MFHLSESIFLSVTLWELFGATGVSWNMSRQSVFQADCPLQNYTICVWHTLELFVLANSPMWYFHFTAISTKSAWEQQWFKWRRNINLKFPALHFLLTTFSSLCDTLGGFLWLVFFATLCTKIHINLWFHFICCAKKEILSMMPDQTWCKSSNERRIFLRDRLGYIFFHYFVNVLHILAWDKGICGMCVWVLSWRIYHLVQRHNNGTHTILWDPFGSFLTRSSFYTVLWWISSQLFWHMPILQGFNNLLCN